jgi:hypothetical protein
VALTDCGDGSWCCQGGNTTCCKEGLGIKIAATIGVSSASATAQLTQSTSSSSAATTSDVTQSQKSTSSGSASSTSSAPVSVANNPDAGTSTPPATSLDPQSGGLDTGTKIGIALSVVLAAVLVAAAIGFWIYTKRRRHYPKGTTSNPWDLRAEELPVSESPGELAEKVGPADFQYEMRGDDPPRVELAAERYSRGPLPHIDRYRPQ